MGIVISQLTVGAADPPTLARWWGEVLGWPTGHDEAEPDEAWVAPPGTPRPGLGGILFIRVPEAKAGKNRVHLDLRPTDGSSQQAEPARRGPRSAGGGAGRTRRCAPGLARLSSLAGRQPRSKTAAVLAAPATDATAV